MYDTYWQANQKLWNKRVSVHTSSAFYDVAGFIAGKTSLNHTELAEVGEISGKSLLHLQCHFGLDTLSWARKGAIVTGLDFSKEAIQFAKSLATQVGQPAEFVCGNVYDTPKLIPERQFDIVFTSYGVLGWLPELETWGKVVSQMLKPNGTFYIVEFHPFIWTLNDNLTAFEYDYFKTEQPIETISKGTYADLSANIELVEYSWNFSLSEVINILIANGLEIESLHEFPFSHYNCFPNLIETSHGKWQAPHLKGIPMMFSIKARKKLG